MLAPIVLRDLLLAAGGTLEVSLPLSLASATSAVFTVVQHEGVVQQWSVRGPVDGDATEAGSGQLRELSEAASGPPSGPPPQASTASAGVKLEPNSAERLWTGDVDGDAASLELECGYDTTSQQLASGTYVLSLNVSADADLDLQIKKLTDMGISVEAAGTLATVVSTVVGALARPSALSQPPPLARRLQNPRRPRS